MKVIEYRREDAEGGITITQSGSYIAVTIATSKTFKSLKGAEKFLSERGYKRVV